MPARLAKVEKALKPYQVRVEKPKSGAHWKAKRDGDGTYTIPAHNGRKTELGDHYLKGLCRHFRIDFDEFMGSM